jgi:hypothetical protein
VAAITGRRCNQKAGQGNLSGFFVKKIFDPNLRVERSFPKHLHTGSRICMILPEKIECRVTANCGWNNLFQIVAGTTYPTY